MPADEAIGLVRLLPQGSLYKASLAPEQAWTLEQYRLTDLYDMLHIILWKMAGCPGGDPPEPLWRPGDCERQAEQAAKARRARERIENTEWRDV